MLTSVSSSGMSIGNCYSMFYTFDVWSISWLKFKLEISWDGISSHMYCSTIFLKSWSWVFLVAQWIRICLPMQGTRVRSLVWEDPTCRGATRPVSHNYWACGSGACALQRERPQQWEARAPRWRVAPTCRNWRKPSHEPKTQHSQK